MLTCIIGESAFLLLVAVVALGWSIIHCGETDIETLLGTTVFGFAMMGAGLSHLRSIVMFL